MTPEEQVKRLREMAGSNATYRVMYDDDREALRAGADALEEFVKIAKQALRQSEARTERNLRESGPSVGPSRFS